MSFVDALRHRLYVLRRGDAYGSEVERELRFHVELEMLAQSGARDVTDAETNARRLLGNTTYYREEVRRMTPLQWIDRVRQDAGYAWRGLRRSPAFTLTVMLTLGLGLGVNAAMYSFLDRLFVRNPGGVVAPDGVMRLYINANHALTRRGSRVFAWFNYPVLQAVREQVGPAVPIAAFTPSDSVLLTSRSTAAATRVSYVTPDYFQVLRLRPSAGRFFAPDEAAIETPSAVAVISDALWHRAFGGDASILGRTVEIRKRQFTVVGIAPPDFAGIDANLAEVWLPLNALSIQTYDKRPWYMGTGNYLHAIARVESAADLARLTSAGSIGVRAQSPQPDTVSALITGPIVEARGPLEEQQEISIARRLAGVALIVLVIACANVANLLLLRAASRRRELAIRRALGVSRGRLYGQLLTESVLLALLSGAAALVFAVWGGGAISRLLLPRVHWAAAPIDSRIIITTLAVTVLVGLIAGLLPAIGAMRPELTSALKTGARDRAYRASRTQAVLLVAQTSLSVVLLVGAGLLVRSLQNVQSIDIGYETDGVVIATTNATDPDRQRTVSAGLLDIAGRLRAMPGARAVAAASYGPMSGYGVARVFIPGRDSTVKIGGDHPTNASTSPEFFRAMGIRLISGRMYDATDRGGTEPVTVVNQVMARGLWPGENPLGKCLMILKPTNPCTRVIGVVSDAHRTQVIEAVGPQLYRPLAQQPDGSARALIVAVNQSQTDASVRTIRGELSRLLPDAGDYSVRTMGDILEPQLRPWRMGAILFSALGLLALVVASVGIYGVMAYAMTQRTHEMGVRLALGAQPADVLNLVLGDGLRVAVIGIAIGVAASLALGRVVTTLLFGVVPNDPSVLILSVVTLAGLAGVACLIPGWRAARVDPMAALRSD